MADSFSKRQREKKKRKKKQEKRERREERKEEDGLNPPEFMYVGADGNLTATPPDPEDIPEVDAEDIIVGIPPKEEKEGDPFQKVGTVKFFDTEKGYGFINEMDSGVSFFVHANDLIEEIKDGDRVTFKEGSSPKGPVAMEVKLNP